MFYPILYNITMIGSMIPSNYYVDDGCNVFELINGQFVPVHVHNRKKDGRPVVILNLDGQKKSYLVYRLLMRACSGMNDEEFNKYVVDHKDCDTTHNTYDNFELVSQAENMRRAGANNLMPFGEQHFNSRYPDSLIHLICQDICDNISRRDIMNNRSVNGQLIDDIHSGRSHRRISEQYIQYGFSYKEYDNSNRIEMAKEVCELLQLGYSVPEVAHITGYGSNFVEPIKNKRTFKYVSCNYSF